MVIGGDNLPLPDGIGLTDLPNIGGGSGPPGPPGSGITGPNGKMQDFEIRIGNKKDSYDNETYN